MSAVKRHIEKIVDEVCDKYGFDYMLVNSMICRSDLSIWSPWMNLYKPAYHAFFGWLDETISWYAAESKKYAGREDYLKQILSDVYFELLEDDGDFSYDDLKSFFEITREGDWD